MVWTDCGHRDYGATSLLHQGVWIAGSTAQTTPHGFHMTWGRVWFTCWRTSPWAQGLPQRCPPGRPPPSSSLRPSALAALSCSLPSQAPSAPTRVWSPENPSSVLGGGRSRHGSKAPKCESASSVSARRADIPTEGPVSRPGPCRRSRKQRAEGNLGSESWASPAAAWCLAPRARGPSLPT